MATNKSKATNADQPAAETTAKAAPAQSAAKQESVYTAAQLADNYKVFGTFREIVVVALRQAGKETATLSEAKKIINDFKNREVKK